MKNTYRIASVSSALGIIIYHTIIMPQSFSGVCNQKTQPVIIMVATWTGSYGLGIDCRVCHHTTSNRRYSRSTRSCQLTCPVLYLIASPLHYGKQISHSNFSITKVVMLLFSELRALIPDRNVGRECTMIGTM